MWEVSNEYFARYEKPKPINHSNKKRNKQKQQQHLFDVYLKVTTIAYESNNNSLWIPYWYTKFHVLPKDVKVRFKSHRNIVWASKIPNYTRRHANSHVSNEGKDPSNKKRKETKKEREYVLGTKYNDNNNNALSSQAVKIFWISAGFLSHCGMKELSKTKWNDVTEHENKNSSNWQVLKTES